MIKNVGLGLRSAHYSAILQQKPQVAWFEVLADNYLMKGSPHLLYLDRIRQSYPMTLHCVGMSLGSTDPLNFDYLKKIKKLINRIQPLLISDHLSWTSFKGQYFHELLPLPFTEEAITHVVKRIREVQDFLEQKIMIENVSSYLCFNQSQLTEWAFLKEIADQADCLILLDINNIYVSAYNHHWNALEYINSLDKSKIAQFHIAGFENKGHYLLDTHGTPFSLEVLKILQHAVKHFGALPTAIEWDSHIPEFAFLLNQASCVKTILGIEC
jgi:uncharacterized protein